MAVLQNLGLPNSRAGAGPGPVFWFGNQVCGDGIVFDVRVDAAKLFGGADPVIEGFILPKVSSLARKDGVGLPGGCPLYSIHDTGNGELGSDEQMDVIGHHHKGVQCEVAKSGITFANDFHDTAGNAGIP